MNNSELFWIVLSLDNSISTKRFDSKIDAIEESRKLAKEYPGMRFHVLQNCGFASAVTQVSFEVVPSTSTKRPDRKTELLQRKAEILQKTKDKCLDIGDEIDLDNVLDELHCIEQKEYEARLSSTAIENRSHYDECIRRHAELYKMGEDGKLDHDGLMELDEIREELVFLEGKTNRFADQE
jgi:hypothetical protein